MAPREAERTVQRSVLDRLIDDNPDDASEVSLSWTQSVRELKRAVRRDLEWLLNTRRIIEPAPEEFTELARSVYHFGLADITSLSAESGTAREWLRKQVAETIGLFEPRLSNVRVHVAPPEPGGPREVRFTVEALLLMEPDPEQVVFDTVLEVTSTTFEVRGGSDA